MIDGPNLLYVIIPVQTVDHEWAVGGQNRTGQDTRGLWDSRHMIRLVSAEGLRFGENYANS